MSASGSQRLEVDATLAGKRLDRALADALARPRHQIERWIDDGLVELDGEVVVRGGTRLKAGVEIRWREPEPMPSTLIAEAEPLAIVHQDADLIVLDKPPGIVVHPGAGRSSGTLVHRLLARFPELAAVGSPERPGIVHRLDRETSGLLLVARSAAAHTALVAAFAARTIEKRYLAIVRGTPKSERGEIAAPIGRHTTDRTKMTVSKRGRPARTTWHVRAAGAGFALLELELHTGRTHQIRVHLRHLGFPLVGDPTYGREPLERERGLRRTALHAWRLALAHPTSGAPLAFEAPVPDDLRALWRELTGREWPIGPG